MLLDVAQIVAHAAREERRARTVDARELEVEERRPAVRPDEDVLLLVKIVVAHAAGVEREHEIVEAVEEVLGQDLRPGERETFDPGALEHSAAVSQEARDAREPRQRRERSSLARKEPPCDPGRARGAPAAGDASHPCRAVVGHDPLDAAQRVRLEDRGNMCSAHRPSILPPAPPRFHVQASAQPIPSDRRIVTRGLSRSFGKKVALHPIDLDLGPGQIVGLLGPNGSGKSTLLRALMGLVRPDSGRAFVDGVEVSGDGTAVRRRSTYAPGEIALYGEMKGAAHLEWLLRGRGREAGKKARAIASDLGLPLEKKVRAYSHGMKRQLLLSAALAPEVGVRILDEATEGLDPSRRGVVLERLADDAARGTTILLSSHHLGEVDRACDVLVFLSEGKKIAEEAAASVAERARRLVRLSFDEGVEMGKVSERLSRFEGARVRIEGLRATVTLGSAEPSTFLSSVLSAPDLPRPRAAEYGELSLSDLYREIYGVEGC